MTRNPDEHEPRLVALRRAIGDTKENEAGSVAAREQRTSDAIDRVRGVAADLRASDERIADLEAGLEAIRDRARRDLRAAQERAEQAETRVAVEAARADAAELRAREAEERLGEIMAVIQQELARSGDSGPR